jgi:hypothetical protein
MVSLLDPKQEADDKRSRIIWTIMITAAVAAVVVIWFYNANKPPATLAEAPHLYTQHGPFIHEPITIERGKYRAFKLDLNRPAILLGTFLVPDRKTNVGCYVLTAENFEKWKTGGEFESDIFTGFVWAGKVDRKLKPDVYYFVLDNRENPLVDIDVQVDLDLN